jgi:hypothetical protein
LYFHVGAKACVGVVIKHPQKFVGKTLVFAAPPLTLLSSATKKPASIDICNFYFAMHFLGIS